MCGEIEKFKSSHNESSKYDEQTHNHTAYAIGAIMSSVAFLEAVINELFSDSTHSYFGAGLSNENTQRLSAVWKLENVRKQMRVLEKYNLALELCSASSFNTGVQPFQDAKLLIQLRNGLVHYVPEPIITSSSKSEIVAQELEKKLRGKFDLNPFALIMNTGIGLVGGVTEWSNNKAVFFPDLCLGYGCTQWAVNTSLKFADEFFSKLGLQPPYEHIRARINVQ